MSKRPLWKLWPWADGLSILGGVGTGLGGSAVGGLILLAGFVLFFVVWIQAMRIAFRNRVLGRFPILVGDFAAESPHIFMGCLCGDVGIPPL